MKAKSALLFFNFNSLPHTDVDEGGMNQEKRILEDFNSLPHTEVDRE